MAAEFESETDDSGESCHLMENTPKIQICEKRWTVPLKTRPTQSVKTQHALCVFFFNYLTKRKTRFFFSNKKMFCCFEVTSGAH